MTTLDAEYLRKVLNYDPSTGLFTWKERVAQRTHIGQLAGCLNKASGYHQLLGHQAHRLAWLYMYGEWPSAQVDHINNVRNDNRIDNLRLATNTQNQQNRAGAAKHSQSGFLGVSPVPSGRWRSNIRVDGKRLCLGTYDTPEEAHRAYLSSKAKLHSFY